MIERRHGENLVVDVTTSPLDDDERNTVGALIVLRDRTIRSSLREMVSQRERLDSYGQIAAGIAHEVKNPLGGIRGAAELLQLWAKDDRGRDTAALIVREVDRISSLVEELMVFARGEELHESEVNLHFILDGVLDLLGHDPAFEQLEVERFYDPSIPEFLADADRLTQVFLNLCRNAAQAMEDGGGNLTITTRMSLDRRIATRDGRRVPAVIVAVSDTGPGIPGDVLERLDTPFFTTKNRGTGLGLAVSRHWVSQHGGTLRIASQPGQGTTVRVALPLRRKKGGNTGATRAREEETR
jgi:two-component system nitrogen regulation sensor histidine kinase GlnL